MIGMVQLIGYIGTECCKELDLESRVQREQTRRYVNEQVYSSHAVQYI